MNDNQRNDQGNTQQQPYAPQGQYAPQQQYTQQQYTQQQQYAPQQMPQQGQYAPQGQYPQYQQKPARPLTFPILMKTLFSPQPENAFRVQQSPLCKWLIVGVAWIITSLAMGSTFVGKFGANFGIGLGFNLILIGAVIGFLFLVQSVGKPQNPGFDNLMDVFATSLLFVIPFSLFAFIFGFFYAGGASVLLSSGLIVGLVMTVAGFQVRLGRVRGNVLWILIAVVLVLVTIVDLTSLVSYKAASPLNSLSSLEDILNY